MIKLARKQLRNLIIALRNLSTKQLMCIVCLLCFMYVFMLVTSFSAPKKTSDELRHQIIHLSKQYIKSLSQEHKDLIDGPYSGRLTGYDLKKTMAVLLQDMLERISKIEAAINNTNLLANSFTNRDVILPVNTEHISDKVQSNSQSEEKQYQDPKNVLENINKKLVPLDRNPVDYVDKRRFASRTPSLHNSLLRGAQEKCNLRTEEKVRHPECDEKMDWMRKHWQSDACYKQMGVDGSDCSFIIYLSEVESYCPRLSFRIPQSENMTKDGRIRVIVNKNVDGLLTRLHNPVSGRKTYDFMKKRIQHLWPKWISALESFLKGKHLRDHARRKIIVHLGLLTSQAGLGIAENSLQEDLSGIKEYLDDKTRGPLGELVQWSDLITVLYLLGHEVVITSEVEELDNIIKRFPSASSPCQVKNNLFVDLIFTDIIGLKQFKSKIQKGYSRFSCLLRIVDTFGTHPKFNNRKYAQMKKLKSPWGMNDLNPKQFYTMFPHTPDNSFMGFVVDKPDNIESLSSHKKKIALVYGKHSSMWKNKQILLDAISEHFEIHATVGDTKPTDIKLPKYVVNHGLLSGEDFQSLLRQATVYVGLGFPYEGPAPLEAIANGAIFLNPIFNPPHGRDTHPFFAHKPTSRLLTSQHPYVEKFIGEPHSYLVNLSDPQQIRMVLQKVVNNPVKSGKVTYEFTMQGMIERLYAQIEHGDICEQHQSQTIWPPPESIQYFLGIQGDTCESTCERKNLYCEPTYFEIVNRRVELQERGISCDNLEYEDDVIFPAYLSSHNKCIFQSDPALFSCAASHPDFSRFCPCRDYIPEQLALCKNCLS